MEIIYVAKDHLVSKGSVAWLSHSLMQRAHLVEEIVTDTKPRMAKKTDTSSCSHTI